MMLEWFFCGCVVGACCAAAFLSRTVSHMQNELQDANDSADYWESRCAQLIRRDIIRNVCEKN
jgi:hypothetical protein